MLVYRQNLPRKCYEQDEDSIHNFFPLGKLGVGSILSWNAIINCMVPAKPIQLHDGMYDYETGMLFSSLA